MKTPEVYISHAWGGESEKIVEQIIYYFHKEGINITLDKKDLGYRESISRFMQALGKSDAIIVVVSNKYLHSEYCMFELLQIYENKDILNRIFPIVLPEVDIAKSVKRVELVKYWEVQTAELESKIRELSSLTHIEGLSEDLNLYQNIRNKIALLTHILKDINTLNIQLHSERDYRDLIDAVKKRLEDTPGDPAQNAAPVTSLHAEQVNLPQPPPESKEQNNRMRPSPVFLRDWRVATGGIVVILLVVTFLLRTCSNRASEISIPDIGAITIAVMPFEFIGGDDSNTYIADGISDDLLTSISMQKEFQVIARAAVASYRNTDLPLSVIAKQLNANLLLTGSVKRKGDRLALTTALVEPGSMVQLWSAQFERDDRHLYDMVNDAAKQILQILLRRMDESTDELNRPATGHPGFEAYKLYLEGRSYFLNYSEADNKKAISYFHAAGTKDSTYAEVWAGLAEAYTQEIKYGVGDQVYMQLDSAYYYARLAISLNPRLPQAYKALGNYYQVTRDLSNAIINYEKAIELNPNYFEVIQNISICYLDKDALDKAHEMLHRSIALNPNAKVKAYVLLGRVYSSLGCDSIAFENFERAVALSALDHPIAYRQMELCFLKSDSRCAEQVLGGVVQLDTTSFMHHKLMVLYGIATKNYTFAYRHLEPVTHPDFETAPDWRRPYILKWLGREKEAEMYARAYQYNILTILEQIEFEDLDDTELNFGLHVFAFLQDRDRFITWLNRSIDLGYVGYRYLSSAPYFDRFRGDKQFESSLLRAKMIHEDMLRNIISSYPAFICN